MLAVQTADGKRVQVSATQQQLAGLANGMTVTVTGTWQQQQAVLLAATVSSSGGSFAAPLLTKAPTAPAAAAAASAAGAAAAAAATLSTNTLVTADINTIVIPMAAKAANGAACPGTLLPKFTKAQVEATMWGTSAPSVGATFGKCSGGKTKLTAATSAVADVVELPCSGESEGVAWSTSTCGFDDFVGWADAADAALTARGVDLSKYKYR